MPEPDDDTLHGLLPLFSQALATGRPLDVLGLTSAALAILTFPNGEEPGPDPLLRERVVEELVGQAVDVGTSEALSLAVAVTALVPDDTLRRRLGASLDGAETEVPPWLARLDDARLETTTVVRDLFDDDEWLLAGVRLADGTRFSFRVEIDHAADGALADGSLMPATAEEVRDQLGAGPGADDVAVTDLTPAELSARYTEALTAAEARGGTAPTETWPGCRPLVEWALRRPEGR